MAIAIRTGTNFSPSVIRIELKGVYADPGEIINLANAHKSFSATDCYVDSVRLNALTNVGYYVLNTGIFDAITLEAPGYTLADETADDIAETLYATDINTIVLDIKSDATENEYGFQLATNEIVSGRFYLSGSVDPSRGMTLSITHYNQEVAGTTIDGLLYIYNFDNDGSNNNDVTENGSNFDFTTTEGAGRKTETYTFSASDVEAGHFYEIFWKNVDATDATIENMQVEYYIKRSV
jgi:hypothetical protein